MGEAIRRPPEPRCRAGVAARATARVSHQQLKPCCLAEEVEQAMAEVTRRPPEPRCRVAVAARATARETHPRLLVY